MQPASLSEDNLRKTILAALDNENEARFIYGDKLFEKLQKHGVSIQDLVYVCRNWEVLRTTRWQRRCWRYRVEGCNLENKWMAVVVAVIPAAKNVIAITGFLFIRGRKKRP